MSKRCSIESDQKKIKKRVKNRSKNVSAWCAHLPRISLYLIENICYDNIAEIMEQTDKFDKQIFDYAKKFICEKLSKNTIENFCKKLSHIKDNDRFGKIIGILETSFGRNWIEMMCSFRSTSDPRIANDIFRNLIEDEQYLNMKKLQAIIRSASKGPGIDLSISTMRGEYGILIKKTTKNEWESGQVIFPIVIDSYSIKNITASTGGFMAGWSTSKTLDPNYRYPGGEGNLKKWHGCLVYNSVDGYCYGYKKKDWTDNKFIMGQWNFKNDKMITSVTKQTIIFIRIRRNKTGTHEIPRDTYNLSDGLLYPTFCHHSPLVLPNSSSFANLNALDS